MLALALAAIGALNETPLNWCRRPIEPLSEALLRCWEAVGGPVLMLRGRLVGECGDWRRLEVWAVLLSCCSLPSASCREVCRAVAMAERWRVATHALS